MSSSWASRDSKIKIILIDVTVLYPTQNRVRDMVFLSRRSEWRRDRVLHSPLFGA